MRCPGLTVSSADWACFHSPMTTAKSDLVGTFRATTARTRFELSSSLERRANAARRTAESCFEPMNVGTESTTEVMTEKAELTVVGDTPGRTEISSVASRID